jgi:PAS domain S-box-containing protein
MESSPEIAGEIFSDRLAPEVSAPDTPSDRMRDQDAAIFHLLMHHAPDVIAALNARGELAYISPSVKHIFGYDSAELIDKRLHDEIHPDDRTRLAAAFNRVSQAPGLSEPVQFRLRHKGGRWRWVEMVTNHVPDHVPGNDGNPNIVLSVRDITERKQTWDQLKEDEALYRTVFSAVSDGLRLIDAATGELKLVNPAWCQMHGYTYDEAMLLGIQDFVPPGKLIQMPQPNELLTASRLGAEFRGQSVNRRKDGTEFPVEIRARGVMYRGRVLELAVVRDISEQRQAVELLEQRVEERTREISMLLRESEQRRTAAEVLRDVLSALNSNKPLDWILDFILQSIGNLLGTDMCAIYKLNPATRMMSIQAARGLPTDFVARVAVPWGKGAVGRASVSRKPLVIDDVIGMLEEDFGDTLEQIAFAVPVVSKLKHLLAVPLLIQNENYGAILLYYPEQRQFDEEDLKLAGTIGDQTALAIENARLRAEAAGAAATAERQRLARDLHDSVSQALYGITLGTRTARELIESSPERAAEPLDYVLSLAEGGLAEMRALIFELKPESLAAEGLAAALKKQAEALCARHGLDVEFAPALEPAISLDAKEALYRIALEAIQNTIKHAHASRVMMRLVSEAAPDAREDPISTRISARAEQFVALEIIDDGTGFDSGQPYPGHMGLQSMRERAESLGGSLEIASQAEHGTRVRARIPLRCEPAATVT